MLPIYAHYVGGEGYGIMGMIDVVLSMTQALIGYGISGAMRRHYFEKESESARNIFVSTNIAVMFLVVIVVTIPALFFSESIAYFALGKENMGFYFTLAFCIFIADMTSKNAEQYILIRQQSILYTSLAISRLFIVFGLNIYFIVYLKMAVLGYLWTNLISAILFSFIMHGYAFYHVGFHYNRSNAIETLRFSIPLVPGSIAMFLRGNADRIILRHFLGLAELGTYEMLFKFATLIGIIIVEPFEQSWDIKRYEICKLQEGPTTIAQIFTLEMALIFFAGIILSLEIPLILKILTPNDFWISSHIAALAVLSRVLWAASSHFAFGIFYSKKMHILSNYQILMAGFSVLVNWWLIKYHGLMGALLANCVIAIGQNICYYYASQKYYFIPFEWFRLLYMFCVACALFFLIDQISFGPDNIIYHFIEDHLRTGINFSYIGQIEILSRLLQNMPIVMEGIVKFLASFVFLFMLLIIDINPKKALQDMK